jgi:hypothetical protein
MALASSATAISAGEPFPHDAGTDDSREQQGGAEGFRRWPPADGQIHYDAA